MSRTPQGWSVRGEAVTTDPCEDGPVLVRHADAVIDGDGKAHEVTRPVVAVCGCDKSQRMPWCDSTHKALARGQGRAAQPT